LVKKLRERLWAPARNIGAHRRALPERCGEGEGRRSEDGEDGSYFIHSRTKIRPPLPYFQPTCFVVRGGYDNSMGVG
jgi:hypothetical protein